MSRVHGIVLCAISVLATTGAWAENGRIALAQPAVIDQSGSYLVTADIHAATGPAISIEAENVLLDLGGHTVSVDPGAGDVIPIADSALRVTIRNGTIAGGDHGVSFFDQNSTLRRFLRIEDVVVRDSDQSGVRTEGMRTLELLRSSLVSPESYGIRTDAVLVRLVDNRIDDSLLDSIHVLQPRACEIRGNRIVNTRAANGAGIFVDDAEACGVIGNHVQNSNGYGIALNGLLGGQIRGNEIEGSRTHGLRIYAGCTGLRSSDNVIHGGDGRGISVESASYVLLEDNQVEGNADAGLYFGSATGHVYRRNMLRGNASALSGVANIDGGGNIQ